MRQGRDKDLDMMTDKRITTVGVRPHVLLELRDGAFSGQPVWDQLFILLLMVAPGL